MRLKKQEKLALADKIRDAAMDIVLASIEFQNLGNHPGKFLMSTIDEIEIGYLTPFTKLEEAPAPYGMDIWVNGKGKVFSIWWDPFEIMRFNYGPWMNKLLPGTYVG